jgi:polysaccharide biosynthesis/export protein
MKLHPRSLSVFVFVVLLVQFPGHTACGSSHALQQVPTPTQLERPTQTDSVAAVVADELPIGSGDLLEISMYGTEDFHESVRVSNSKVVMLPLIGAVEVVGLSPTSAAELIRKRLVDGNFYTNPQISVFVKEYATEGVYVLGEVQKPGSYSILNARDVMQAISLAGGTTPKAGRLVTIKNPTRPEAVTMNLASSLSGKLDKSAATEVKLLPGDTIVVSKAGIVYVVGDVHLPSGIIMESENLTVLQAIAMAQGTNPTASLNGTKLIRRGPDGPKEESISLKKILEAKAPDIKVQADDIIFVPVSTAKSVSKRGLEAILQAATGVVMYSHY